MYRWYMFVVLLKDINKIFISSSYGNVHRNIGQKGVTCFCWTEISIEHLKIALTVLFFSVFNKVTKWL